MDSTIVDFGTDGPLTRSRRRALEQASEGPWEHEISSLDDGETCSAGDMARALFASPNEEGQAQAPHGDSEVSPVQAWVSKEGKIEASELETPGAHHRLDSVLSPEDRAVGTTPNNTPSIGACPDQSVEMLLDKAMHELQGSSLENSKLVSPALAPNEGSQIADRVATCLENSPTEVVQKWAAAVSPADAISDKYCLGQTPERAAGVSKPLPLALTPVFGTEHQDADSYQTHGKTPQNVHNGVAGLASPASLDVAPPTVAGAASATPGAMGAFFVGLHADATGSGLSKGVAMAPALVKQAGRLRPPQTPPAAASVSPGQCSPPQHVAKTPAITFGGLPPSGGTPGLAAAGRDDDAPTPAPFQSHATVAQRIVAKSPATPDDVAFKPIAFTKSAGSYFATPEVPIATGMTPTVSVGANARQAQRHVPAWNRVHRIVRARAPIAFQQVRSLQSMPSTADQPAWAKTPFMLLRGLSATKGWTVLQRKETEGRIGEPVAIAMTLSIPGAADDPASGTTVTAVESTSGYLEAVILAAAVILQELFEMHLVSGADAVAAVDAAVAAARPQRPGSPQGGVGKPKVAFGRQSKGFIRGLPPAPRQPPLHAQATGHAPRATTSIPHPGIGVRALPHSAHQAKAKPRASLAPVHLGPTRLGTSSVSNTQKGTIAASAKSVGGKARGEALKENERGHVRSHASMNALERRLKKLNVKSPVLLRGVPPPSGKHVMFDDKGIPRERVHQRDELLSGSEACAEKLAPA